LSGAVREAGVEDAATVARLLHEFNTEFREPSPGITLLAERLRGLLAGSDVLALLASEPAVGVALVTFRPSVWDSGPVALLDELYVVPSSRSRGFGAQLLQGAVASARERGTNTFEINVDSEDADARRFYEREGFRHFAPGTRDGPIYYRREL
jgi:GNAT superfamily N-acetyltransferase